MILATIGMRETNPWRRMFSELRRPRDWGLFQLMSKTIEDLLDTSSAWLYDSIKLCRKKGSLDLHLY